MLTTLIPPTSGTARVVGFDILKQPADVRARIGYVGQLTSGSFSQRARDELLSQGAFYGDVEGRPRANGPTSSSSRSISRASRRGRCSSCRAGRSAGSTSRSASCTRRRSSSSTSRRRASTRRAARTCGSTSSSLRGSHGTTVFLTTHYLEEADRYAERVMVMDKGRVIADDTADAPQGEPRGRPADASASPRTPTTPTRAVAVVAGLTDREVRHGGRGVRRPRPPPDGDALLPTAVRRAGRRGPPVRTRRPACRPPSTTCSSRSPAARCARRARASPPRRGDETQDTTDASPRASATAELLWPRRQERTDDRCAERGIRPDTAVRARTPPATRGTCSPGSSSPWCATPSR